MKFKSEIVTQASGSIGGTTYSRAKGGVLYRRARAIPVNPGSPFQEQVRSLVTSLVNTWTGTLTQAQRDGWEMYAQNVPVTNLLGDSVNLSGQNWFIGSNVARGQAATKLGAALNLVLNAPTVFNRGEFTTPTTSSISVAAGFSVTFDNTDEWANEDDGAMLIFQGRPRNAGRNFFNGPYRLVAAIEGDAVTPPTSPESVSAATLTAEGFTVSNGERVSLVAAVVREDGRYSTRRSYADVIVA